MIITSDKKIDDNQDYFFCNNCHPKQITGKLKIKTSSFFLLYSNEKTKKKKKIRQ
jgi:hypothetical protein